MSNPDYNSQTNPSGNSKKGGAQGYKFPKNGVKGAEHGAAFKDSTVTWTGAPGPTRPNFNKTGAPQVKTAVVCDGVLNGGQDHFTK